MVHRLTASDVNGNLIASSTVSTQVNVQVHVLYADQTQPLAIHNILNIEVVCALFAEPGDPLPTPTGGVTVHGEADLRTASKFYCCHALYSIRFKEWYAIFNAKSVLVDQKGCCVCVCVAKNMVICKSNVLGWSYMTCNIFACSYRGPNTSPCACIYMQVLRYIV